MRLKIPRLLSPHKAKKIRKVIGRRDFYEEDIWYCTEAALKVAPVKLNYPAYCEVQRLARGHEWHKDTGNYNHMVWCKWSAQLLLSPASHFEGGGLYFRDSEEPEDKYLTMLIYSSDVAHKILPHTGDRRVLVMFFQ